MRQVPDRVVPVLRRVAAAGLKPPTFEVAGPLDEPTWSIFLSEVQRERLGGLAAVAVAEGSLVVTAEQHDAVRGSHLVAMRTVLKLEAQLLDLVEVLTELGVDHRVLKGSAVTHLDYEDVNVRCYGDVDVLVPGSQLAMVVGHLERGGWTRDLPERRAHFDERFGKEVCLRRPGSFELDLHRTLVPGAFGFAIQLEDLWDRSEEFRVGGVELRALPLTSRFIHACYTAMLSDPEPKLIALRDLAVMARRPAIDLQDVATVARRWGGSRVLERALTTCRMQLGDVLPLEVLEWSERLPIEVRGDRLLRTYRAHGGSVTSTLLAGVLGLPQHRLRLAYLRAMVFPDKEYRLAREQGHRSAEWRHGLADLLPGRSTARRTRHPGRRDL